MKQPTQPMNFKRSLEIIDPINKIVATLAILIAGIWAYRTYGVERAGASNIVISVTSTLLDYTDNKKVLVVRVDFKNVGKVIVRPAEIDAQQGGCILTLTRLPNEAPDGAILNRDATPIVRQNILNRYAGGNRTSGSNYEFWIEPNAEEHLIEAVPLPADGGLYYVRAQFFFRSGRSSTESISNHQIVRVK